MSLRTPGRPGVAERLYQLLLHAYPPDFRAEYGGEMALLFRDRCREGEVRSIRFWAAVISDVARSAPALRAEAWQGRMIMKLAALLTVFLGVYVTLNAVVEGVAGSWGTMSGAYVLAIALGLLAGALLLIAGVALRRGTPSGRKTANAAALASLVLIVGARLVFPWMSIFSQLVSIGIPIALLIALHWPRRPSASGAV